jgi:hypothetical protein
LFFAAFYVHVWAVIEPPLIYDGARLELPSGRSPVVPVFWRGVGFLEQFLDRPGGSVEYAAAWLSQYYYCPRLGPLVLTVVAALVYLLEIALMRALGGTGRGIGPYLVPVFLLVAWNQYAFRLEPALALVAALALTDFYLAVARRTRHAAAPFLAFAACAVLLYCVAGGMLVLFALLAALFELLVQRRYVLGLVYPTVAALVPVIGKAWFAMPLADAYCHLLGVWPWEGGLVPTMLLATYLLLLVMAVWLPLRPQIAALARRVWHPVPRLAWLGQSGLPTAVAFVLLAAGACAAAWGTVDREARRTLQLNSLARREKWPELLAELDQGAPVEYTPSLICDVNRALFQTGRLPSRMFAYPQNPDALFATGQRGARVEGSCDVLLRLGCVNEAEHVAHEALELDGNRPAILRQLAVINVVKDRPEAAAVFLGALRKDIIHGAWAEDWLRRLAADPAMNDEPEVRRLRSVMIERDAIDNATSTSDLLLSLLEKDRKNRMAFEYLMAWYLLSVQPGGVVAQIGRLSDFDYPEVPPLYAEAIALVAHNAARRARVPGRAFPDAAVRRVEQVVEIAEAAKGDKEAMREPLAERFPDSACRYFLMHESGAAR